MPKAPNTYRLLCPVDATALTLRKAHIKCGGGLRVGIRSKMPRTPVSLVTPGIKAGGWWVALAIADVCRFAVPDGADDVLGGVRTGRLCSTRFSAMANPSTLPDQCQAPEQGNLSARGLLPSDRREPVEPIETMRCSK